MKKLLILALIVGSISIVAPTAANAKTSSSVNVDPQIRVQIGGQNRYRGRTRTYTRIVGYGRNRFRETVRVTYQRNGRTRTQVLSRVRIGRN